MCFCVCFSKMITLKTYFCESVYIGKTTWVQFPGLFRIQYVTSQHISSKSNEYLHWKYEILSAPRLAWQLLLYNVQSLSHIIAVGLQSGQLLRWHLHLSGSCCWRLYGTFVEGLTTQSGCQSFSKHTAQEHIDQRVQTYISGRQPQRGFLGDVECILGTAMTRYAASLGQSVRNADKVKGSKADEKYSHNHKHLCFGSVSSCLSSAFWGFVWLINLFADERVANHHQGQGAPENHL